MRMGVVWDERSRYEREWKKSPNAELHFWREMSEEMLLLFPIQEPMQLSLFTFSSEIDFHNDPASSCDGFIIPVDTPNAWGECATFWEEKEKKMRGRWEI